MNTHALVRSAGLAAVVILTGMTSTAPATADEQTAFDASRESPEQIEQTSREQAREANEAAVEEAAEAVEADTRLDLDTRLIDPISGLIAGDV